MWPMTRLGDHSRKIGSGATPRGGGNVYQAAGMTLIRSQNVYNHGFERAGLAYIGDVHAAQLSNASVERGDVLLNITGDSVARCCLVPDEVLPARVNQHVAIVRPDAAQIDARYLRYWLISPQTQDHLLALASAGATRNALTKRMIEDLQVPEPSLSEQRAIADMLGVLDGKIALNRRMNEALEAIARAIFKSWFVDFDPVRAKTEGREPFGMDAARAALFPDAFEDSPLGKVPQGWKATSLTDLVEVNPSRSIARGQRAPYVEMSNMPNSSARVLDWVPREFTSGSKFMSGDVLVARITPCLENGKTAYVDFLEEGDNGWGSTEFIVLRSKGGLPPEYAYFLARTDDFRSFAIGNMTGTSGRQRVPTDVLSFYQTVLPPPPIAARFGAMAAPIMRAMKQHDDESRTLAELRDTLLPKLLSGEVRVTGSKRMAARAK